MTLGASFSLAMLCPVALEDITKACPVGWNYRTGVANSNLLNAPDVLNDLNEPNHLNEHNDLNHLNEQKF